MSSMEVRIDVKGMDSALKKAKTNIERFGNLYTTLLAYNTASGMCFNATLPLGKNRKSKVSGRKSGEGAVSRDVSRAGRGVGSFINQLKERDIKRARQVAGMLSLKADPQKAAEVATDVLGRLCAFIRVTARNFILLPGRMVVCPPLLGMSCSIERVRRTIRIRYSSISGRQNQGG